MMFFRGVVYFITGGFVWPVVIYNTTDQMMLDFLSGSTIWYYILAAIFSVILTYTFYGNRVMAVGRSKETARYMGVNYQKVKVINFVLCGLFAALGGALSMGRFRIASPTTGTQLELEAIAAAVIGGNVLTGGYGSIVGSVFGALIVSMVRSGLILAGAPVFWYTAFVGLILLAAALIQGVIRGGQAR